MPAHDRKAAVRAALAVTGLARHEHSLASKLNAYERRMVEITRAIVGSPKLIMMDEPAAGLSEHETKQFQAIMTTLPARTGATILLIDHDVDLIAALCERTAVLDFGQLIAYGSTRDVLDDERVRAAYLGVVDDGELDGALAGAEELL
jgi:branched-chain amino acid transport system ATP-binding protein